ncbi:uncharacterized protein LOC141678480 isoform X2 [Apium graveolens]|uniref:uncharacterized protein LOC141678480 isoform X2 n=1 Tax=Apium graveolens TaxID=4045 RepID=UPI003D792799
MVSREAWNLFWFLKAGLLEFWVFKKKAVVIKPKTKAPGSGAEINTRPECLCDKQPNPVGNNGQGVRENDVTEKMTGGLIIMSHYILMLNKYVGSNKPNHLLIFVIHCRNKVNTHYHVFLAESFS